MNHVLAQSWPTKRENKLLKMWNDGATVDKLCAEFNCGLGSITNKLHRLKKKGKHVAKRPRGQRASGLSPSWTTAELDYVADGMLKGLTSKTMSSNMERTIAAVNSMMPVIRADRKMESRAKSYLKDSATRDSNGEIFIKPNRLMAGHELIEQSLKQVQRQIGDSVRDSKAWEDLIAQETAIKKVLELRG